MKSWRLAVARYHSATPQRSAAHRTKVYDFLSDERHMADQERRAAAKEHYRRWQAEKDAKRAQLQHTPTHTYMHRHQTDRGGVNLRAIPQRHCHIGVYRPTTS